MSTIGAYFRLARVGWVLVREGVVAALPSEGLPPLVGMAKAAVAPLAATVRNPWSAPTALREPSRVSGPPM